MKAQGNLSLVDLELRLKLYLWYWCLNQWRPIWQFISCQMLQENQLICLREFREISDQKLDPHCSLCLGGKPGSLSRLHELFDFMEQAVGGYLCICKTAGETNHSTSPRGCTVARQGQKSGQREEIRRHRPCKNSMSFSPPSLSHNLTPSDVFCLVWLSQIFFKGHNKHNTKQASKKKNSLISL